MKKMKFISSFCALSLTLGVGSLSVSAYAKDLTLYDQPIATAKVVGKVDMSVGIIPIFTPKDGQWVKIADPRNGNVGWVKSSDLKSDSAENSSYIFTQKIVTTGKQPQSIIYVQNQQQPSSSDAKTQEIIKKMQAEQIIMQQNIQRNVQKMFQDFSDSMNRAFDSQKPVSNQNPTPPAAAGK